MKRSVPGVRVTLADGFGAHCLVPREATGSPACRPGLPLRVALVLGLTNQYWLRQRFHTRSDTALR